MMAIQHPMLGAVRMEAVQVPDEPDEQVAATIALMRRYALEDARSRPIQADVARICGLMCRDQWDHTRAAACWQWVKNKIRFVQDNVLGGPIEQGGMVSLPIVEVLVRPADISNGAGVGDCDDYSMYLASLLTACNIPCNFVTAAADDQVPGQYSHVYVAAYPQGQRMPLDASHGPRAGWEVPDATRRTEWPVYPAATEEWI